MNSKTKTTKAALNGADNQLAAYLKTMKVHNWEHRLDSKGRQHLYIRCVPKTSDITIAVA